MKCDIHRFVELCTIHDFSFCLLHRCCDRLHCTSCDNGIVCFDDYKWDESKCDYLAFRNNYPDYSRLKHLLSPRKGKNDNFHILVLGTDTISQPAKSLKSNTGVREFLFNRHSICGPYSQKYTPPHCFFCNFADWD